MKIWCESRFWTIFIMLQLKWAFKSYKSLFYHMYSTFWCIRDYMWCHGCIQYTCGPAGGPLITWKLYTGADFELFSPYFSWNLQLNYINYRFYHMYYTLWCIWDYMWCYGSIRYIFDPAGVLVMTWKLHTRADFELFSPYFSPYSAHICSRII